MNPWGEVWPVVKPKIDRMLDIFKVSLYGVLELNGMSKLI